MRARNIKPSLFKNELLGTADPLLTILFEGLWCEADRDGRLEDRPLRLKAEIFPYRNDVDMESLLNWLARNDFIARYEALGIKVIQVLKFSDHQRPHKNEVASVLPSLDQRKHNQGTKSAQPRRKALRSDSPSLIPDSGSLIPDTSMSASPSVGQKPDDPTVRVFEHWQTVHSHPQSVLSAARRKLIQDRLKEFSEADLCHSITGYLNSPHHMGQNERDTVYNDIGLFLRDSKHVEAGLQFYRQPPRKGLSAKTRQNVDAIADWVPPETRRAAS